MPETNQPAKDQYGRVIRDPFTSEYGELEPTHEYFARRQSPEELAEDAHESSMNTKAARAVNEGRKRYYHYRVAACSGDLLTLLKSLDPQEKVQVLVEGVRLKMQHNLQTLPTENISHESILWVNLLYPDHETIVSLLRLNYIERTAILIAAAQAKTAYLVRKSQASNKDRVVGWLVPETLAAVPEKPYTRTSAFARDWSQAWTVKKPEKANLTDIEFENLSNPEGE